MLWVIGALFAGWILNLFGFENLVIGGMQEFFNVTITMTGYYFLFGVIGMIKFILYTPKGVKKEIPSFTEHWEEAKRKAELKESLRKKGKRSQ